MSFPEDALAPHETLVLHLRPHWWFIFKSGFVLVATIVFAFVVMLTLDVEVLLYAAALMVVVALGWFLVRFAKWISTHFVLTSDRVIHRAGVIAKNSIEIPLDRINTVFFQQRIFERMLGLGDLEIESASKDGAQRFEDIRKPPEVQKEIYVQMESNANRKMDRMGAAAHGAPQAAPAPVAPSAADQISQLAQLRDAGHITPAEYEAKKAELLGRM